MNTEKVLTTSYHPQWDGLVERFNSTMAQSVCRQQPEELGYIFKRYPVCLLHKSKRRHW